MKKYAFSAMLLTTIIAKGTSLAADNYCTPPCETFCCDNISGPIGYFKIGADWLYWQAKQDNQPTATLNTDNLTTFTSTHDDIRTTYSPKNGYRITLGYESPCDPWEGNAIFTYFPGEGHTPTTTPGFSQTITTLFSNAGINGDPAVNFPVASYSSKWRMKMNMLDLDLARKLYYGESFTLRPHIGFRALWLKEKLTATMPLVLPAELASTTTGLGIGVLKEQFFGYGIEGGLWASWDFNCGLSLVGHFGGSILYSRFRVTSISQEIDTTLDGIVTTTYLNTLTNDFKTGTPTVDYYLGLQYTENVCDWELSFHFGWEQHIFFGMNHLNQLISEGNLYTQGLVLGFDAKF